MEMNFCRRCGTKLTVAHDHVYTCENGHPIYANCSPSVGIFLINDKNQVLLSVRGIEPHKGMLDAFGGIVDGEEEAEAAVRRELEEELGLKESEYSSLIYLTSGVGHYPYKGEILSLLSLFYWAQLQTTRPLTPKDDVAAIHFSDVNKIDLSKLHDEDIRIGVRKLQEILA